MSDAESQVEAGTSAAANQAGLGPERKRQQRHLLACAECRKIKTRCLGNEDQKTPCTRCQRLSLKCVYQRKRARVAPSTASPRPSPPVAPAGPPLVPAEPPAPARRDRRDVMSESDLRSSAPSTPAPSKRLDIREYLNPALEPVPATRASRTVGGVQDDPISLGLVTLREAETLLGLYLEHINPIIGTLDPHLHTPAYTRSSPILLSALLTVSAKFFRRPLYHSLLSHTKTLVDRAVGLGQCDIGVIQALMVLIVWKEPQDASAWVKLGIAIRLAYQLGLHVPRTAPLPHIEGEARLVANIERTWYTLAAFDRLYSDIFSLPPTIRLEEIPDATRWAGETAWLGCGDMRHACSYSSAGTYRMWVKYRRDLPSMSRELAWGILEDLYAQIEAHIQRWFPEDPADGDISQWEQTYLKWFDLNHLLKIKYHMLDLCPPAERSSMIVDWIRLAEAFTLQTESLGAIGALRFFQDTGATHMSSFGVMIYNLFARLSPHQKSILSAHVVRMSQCADGATEDEEEETVMSLVGRFLRRLHQVLEGSHARPYAPSMTAGAAVGTVREPLVANGDMGLGVLDEMGLDPNDPHGAVLDLDEFFRSLLQGPQPQDFADYQFWFEPVGVP